MLNSRQSRANIVNKPQKHNKSEDTENMYLAIGGNHLEQIIRDYCSRNDFIKRFAGSKGVSWRRRIRAKDYPD